MLRNICAVLTCVLALPAAAQDLARDGLAPTIALVEARDGTNGFELGMLRTLRAVEKTLQSRHDYGLGQQIPMLPILRLGAATMPNPSPQPSGPDTLSAIMDTFVTDMAAARADLERTEADGITPFEMTLQDIWFDVNGNGRRDTGEGGEEILGPVVLGQLAYDRFRRSEAASAPLTIRFDAADHAWLLAYTHMLSGVGNLFLAFDPEPILSELDSARAALDAAPTIANYYDQAALAEDIAALEQELAPFDARIEALRQQQNPVREERNALFQQREETTNEADKAAIDARIDTLYDQLQDFRTQIAGLTRDRRLIQNEIAAAKAKMDPGSDSELQQMANQQRATVDMIYALLAALQQQPDKARLQAAHADWLAMIRHNLTFWDRLARETDNDREWIPNATQVSVLPVEIPPRVAEAWQTILADAEAVLEGRLLIPHPLLPPGYGINLPAYIDDPAPLDLTRWIHGIGAYPYAARGPRITGQSWQAFERLTGGNAAGFALFFN